MHKVIVASIVAGLAGTCFVLAQNASSKQFQSPYRQAPGMLPHEKAEALTLAPTTPLDLPANLIPPRPDFFPSVGIPPLDPPPGETVVPQSPIAKPDVLQLPASELKPTNVSTKSALPGMPTLPPVPGVSSPPLGDLRARYDGVIIPQPLRQPGEPAWNANQPMESAPLPKGDPRAPMHVDPPNYWRERQRLADHWAEPEFPERIMGPRIWGSADYLLWFARPQSSPALIQAVTGTSGSATTFNPAQVVTLFPYNDIDPGISSGVRGTIGFWLNPMQTIGFEATYMWFSQNCLCDGYQSTNNAILGRPFIEASTGRDTLYQVSAPGVVDGLIAVNSTFQLQGGEANFVFNSQHFGPQFNLLAGIRYLDISENLLVSQNSTGSNFSIDSYDQFYTRNQFWGGQVGLRWTYEGCRLFANVAGKIGFGAMNERVRIDGNTFVSNAGGTTQAMGGVLALSSNIGTYNRTTTAFVPEAVVNLGYKFAPWGTVTVGYNFLYATEVVRPGSQIDYVVNTSNLPFAGGISGQPSFQFKGDSFWVQGISFGLMLRY
jgi:Putative beta barrel porin-7 (BBP7)